MIATIIEESVEDVEAHRRCISWYIKRRFANENELDFDRLLNDIEYKEEHRDGLIELANTEREKNPYVWVELLFTNIIDDIIENVNEAKAHSPLAGSMLSPSVRHIIIISDCRFLEQIEFCEAVFGEHNVFTVRVKCDNKESRGWSFKPGVDDDKTETALDNYGHGYMIDNNGTKEALYDKVRRLCYLLGY